MENEREPWEIESQTDRRKYPHDAGKHFELKKNGTASRGHSAPSDLPFDLEERTAKFGEAIIRFVKKMPMNAANNRLIDQLVGCGTSIGGNYCEADEAVSRKEFANKIGIATCYVLQFVEHWSLIIGYFGGWKSPSAKYVFP